MKTTTQSRKKTRKTKETKIAPINDLDMVFEFEDHSLMIDNKDRLFCIRDIYIGFAPRTLDKRYRWPVTFRESLEWLARMEQASADFTFDTSFSDEGIARWATVGASKLPKAA